MLLAGPPPQRRVDYRRRAGGVEVDRGARLARPQRLALAVQFDEALRDILIAGVDHRIGTDRQRLLQPGADQVHHGHMADTESLIGDGRAEPDRPGTEYGDLVRRCGLGLIDPVPGDRHRLVEAATSNGISAGMTSMLWPRTAFSTRRYSASAPVAPPLPMIPLGAPIGLMTTWSPDVDAGHVATDLDHLAGRLVPERHPPPDAVADHPSRCRARRNRRCRRP